jgi:RND superfamily putative drug exporter
MSVLARWCHRRRLVTLFAWLALLVGLGALSGTIGTKYNDTMSIPASESSKAMDLLKATMPASSGDSDTVVWHVTNGGSVTDPAVKDRMTRTLAQISQAPGVASVVSPYDPRGSAQVSKDGTIAYAQVNFAQSAHDVPKAEVTHVMDLANAGRTGGLDVQLGGQAISEAGRQMSGSSEIIGVFAALIILGLVFRSAWAAALPVVTGVAGVMSGILGIGAISHLVSISSTAPTLGALVGLGVGIDWTRRAAG